MKHPEVGKRDGKGRLFCGWAILAKSGTYKGWFLLPSSYSFSDRRSRVTAVQWRDTLNGTTDWAWTERRKVKRWLPKKDAVVVRLYKCESKTRRVLRELVGAIESGTFASTGESFVRAQQHLEET